jgi:hypothetical protein
VRVKNIVLAAAVGLSASGCSEEGPEPSICEERGMECTGDTVCGATECERAFDRAYEIEVTSHRIGVGLCQQGADCPLAPVTVYYNSEPIMRVVDSQVAEIDDVTAGSSLIFDFESDQCAVDLTAERLRIGHSSCNGSEAGVTMTLDPMPL